MKRQNLFADSPWDEDAETGARRRVFWRPNGARMGATLYELPPGDHGDKLHMHYNGEEMFFVLSGRLLFRNLEGEEELGAGDFVFCPEGRAGTHTFTNPYDEPGRLLAMSAGGFPDVVAYPEHGYAWLATRDPDPDLPPGDDPGIIARFEFRMDKPDDRVS
jgi:uncharacterized cupin superfamily protein